MSEPLPWTVVSHAADESPAAVGVSHLLGWLAQEPSVQLHSILWAPGPGGTKPYRKGRFANVGAAHRHPAVRLLKATGQERIGGGLAGRLVRTKVRGVPRTGVVYLSSAGAGAVLRYLPDGPRIVITHLHAIDREADPPLPTDKVERLVEATHVWLASDEETRAWAAASWGIEPDAITVVPEPVDPTTWTISTRRADPDRLRLGLAGAPWFGSDHSARVVQVLRRHHPDLTLDLTWARQVASPDHLAPMLHDLRHLGFEDPPVLPASTDEVLRVIDDLDVLAISTPDDHEPWLVWEAAARGLPIVCFATHHAAATLPAGNGTVVPYPDPRAMAEAVAAIHREAVDTETATIDGQRAALRKRDVTILGPELIELARRAGAS